MTQSFVQWWLQSIQSAFNAHQPMKHEDPWAPFMIQNYLGLNRTFSQFWGLWPTTTEIPQASINWQFLEDALSQYQKFYLQWISMATPITTEKIESRIAVLEKQANAQTQEIERLRSRISKRGDQLPESVSAIQKLIEKQGREFHRLTDGFKALAKENAKPSETKK